MGNRNHKRVEINIKSPKSTIEDYQVLVALNDILGEDGEPIRYMVIIRRKGAEAHGSGSWVTEKKKHRHHADWARTGTAERGWNLVSITRHASIVLEKFNFLRPTGWGVYEAGGSSWGCFWQLKSTD